MWTDDNDVTPRDGNALVGVVWALALELAVVGGVLAVIWLGWRVWEGLAR